MKKRIAVESQLSNVSDYLENQGYDVLEFQHNQSIQNQIQDVDAIITSGMDKDFVGMHNIKTQASVIDASGLSPQQIGEMLESKLV